MASDLETKEDDTALLDQVIHSNLGAGKCVMKVGLQLSGSGVLVCGRWGQKRAHLWGGEADGHLRTR